MDWLLSIVVSGIELCAGLDEPLNHRQLACGASRMDRLCSIIALGIHLRAFLDEPLSYRQVAF